MKISIAAVTRTSRLKKTACARTSAIEWDESDGKRWQLTTLGPVLTRSDLWQYYCGHWPARLLTKGQAKSIVWSIWVWDHDILSHEIMWCETGSWHYSASLSWNLQYSPQFPISESEHTKYYMNIALINILLNIKYSRSLHLQLNFKETSFD